MSGSAPGIQNPSQLWNKAVEEHVAQLDPADAQALKRRAPDPSKFIADLTSKPKSPKNDRVLKSFEKLNSALLLVSSAVPDFTSVAWCSAELLYNNSQRLDGIHGTVENVFVELADSLPRLLSYEVSTPHEELNRFILSYYTAILRLFRETDRYVKECSKKRHIISGPPDHSHLSELIRDLKKLRSDIEAEANAVSVKQNHHLMQEVRKFMDQVVIEPKAKLPCHMIAYPENPGFCGRADILQRIETALRSEPGKLKSYSLYGMGGVGKTQLALRMAYSHTNEFKAIFWISARTTEKLNQGILDAAQQLGLVESGANNDQNKVVNTFMSWLRSVTETWLIIFDNADDLVTLAPFWPSASQGSILVTSRDPAVVQRTWRGERIKVLDSADAKDMFFNALAQHTARTDENQRLAEAIFKELGYLPLAIKAATGIIVESECSLEDFISLCDENKHEPEPFAHLEPEFAFDYGHTLGTVWRISLQKIDARSTQLLRILTYLDPDAVPEALFRKGAREHPEVKYLSATVTWLKISRELRKHGLCSKANMPFDLATAQTPSESPLPGIATHKLVLEAVFRSCSESDRQTALEQVVALLKSEFPSVSDSQFRLSSVWRECHVLLPQTEALINRCRSNNLLLPSSIVPVLCACGRYLLERRSFKAAEAMFTVAQDVCKSHELREWEQAQFVERSLGGIILESSAIRSDEAVGMFKEVVAHYEETLDADDPIVGVAYSDLAQALTARGEYDKAILLCEKALAIVAKISCDKTRRDTMFHVHHNMARIYEMKKMPDEALRLHFYQGDAHGNGLREEKSVYGAWNLYAIGNCLQLQKDPRAKEVHAKALKIRQDLFADHYYTAISYHKLGQLYLEEKAYADANTSFEQAHKILNDPLGDTQAELARTLWYWSAVKDRSDEQEEAEKLKAQAVKISNKLLGGQKSIGDEWTSGDFDSLVVYYNR